MNHMPFQCQDMDRYFSVIFDETVSPDDRVEFFSHLEHCEACRAKYRAECRLKSALVREAQSMVLPDDFTASVLQRIEPRSATVLRKIVYPLAAVAACVMLTFVAFRAGLFQAPTDGTVVPGVAAQAVTGMIDTAENSAEIPELYSVAEEDESLRAKVMRGTGERRERENSLVTTIVDEVLRQYDTGRLAYCMNITMVADNKDALCTEFGSKFDLVVESDRMLIYQATADENVLRDYFAAFGTNLTGLQVNRVSENGETALLFITLLS